MLKTMWTPKTKGWEKGRARYKSRRDADFAEWWAKDAPKVEGYRADDRMKELCREAWDEGTEWANWSLPETEAFDEWAWTQDYGVVEKMACSEWFLSKYEGPTPELVKVAFLEVDDEVYALIQENAEPLADTPNSVLRRLLKLDRRKRQDPPKTRSHLDLGVAGLAGSAWPLSPAALVGLLTPPP